MCVPQKKLIFDSWKLIFDSREIDWNKLSNLICFLKWIRLQSATWKRENISLLLITGKTTLWKHWIYFFFFFKNVVKLIVLKVLRNGTPLESQSDHLSRQIYTATLWYNRSRMQWTLSFSLLNGRKRESEKQMCECCDPSVISVQILRRALLIQCASLFSKIHSVKYLQFKSTKLSCWYKKDWLLCVVHIYFQQLS